MISKLPDRANMPDISNTSLDANYALSIKQNKKPLKGEPVVLCQTCNKSYNQTEADKIIPNFSTKNQCLTCAQEESQRMKASYLPDLKESKLALIELTKQYQQAHNNHKALAAKYQKYDYIENIIHHHLTKPATSAKPASSKTPKTSEQSKKAAALKIIANLTEEQRSAILATIAKQA